MKSVSDKGAQGEAVATHVAKWPLFRKCETMTAFVSLPWEIDTAPLLYRILQMGKTLALPRIEPNGQMTMRKVEDLSHLQRGTMGIMEPGESCAVIPPKTIDLVILPALAVDVQGGRLGQGGGYYDRYLEKATCPAAALVLCEQVLSHAVPCSSHDYLIQYIITQGGIVRTNRKTINEGAHTI